MSELLALVGLFVVGAAAVGGYSYFTRAPGSATARGDAPAVRTAMAAAPTSRSAVSFTAGGASTDAAAKSDGKTDERVAAIEALAKAPTTKAIPALEKVINTSSEETEWRAALRTLGTLAQSQGDPDETIRNGLREAISHTTSEALQLGAQETLDGIDRAVYEAATGREATFDNMRGAAPPEGTPPSPPPTDD